MSRGVNKVIIVGTLGADPEVRQTKNGTDVCNMRMATNEWRRSANSEDREESTEWHSVVLFKRLAEIAGKYLHKGSQVYIEGKLRTRKWTDKEGRDRYSTEIIGNEMQMLGSSGGGGGRRDRSGSRDRQENRGNQAPADNGNSNWSSENGNKGEVDFDDDIPF